VNAIIFLTNREADAPSDILVELMAGHWDRAVDIVRGKIQVQVQKDGTAAQYRELEAEWEKESEEMKKELEEMRKEMEEMRKESEKTRKEMEEMGNTLKDMKKSKDEEIGRLQEELRLEREDRKLADMLYSFEIEKAVEQRVS
jgi:uncharacterized protein YlxW (UPF0749 family)